ncbi:Ig-like domain-containing protein [Metabacillus mangrovi]|nr:Ig-like domain-containing protein [Metabacillus mangrovi]
MILRAYKDNEYIKEKGAGMKRFNGVALKLMMAILLLISFSGYQPAEAAEQKVYKEGTYTVGKEIAAGLNKITAPGGTAEISFARGDVIYVEEVIEDEYEDVDQFTASLKAGDEIIIESYAGPSGVHIEHTAKADLNYLPNGLYEIGKDIPAGKYALDFPEGNSSLEPEIYILDSAFTQKDGFILLPEDPALTRTLTTGDYLYVSFVSDTMYLKLLNPAPSSITLDKTSLQIPAGNSHTLKATVLPVNAFDKSVTWSSSSKQTATVDSKGKVTAIAPGTAVIIATAKANPSVKKSITITVTKPLPASISLSKGALNITPGQTYKVTATVLPIQASDKTVQWKSSNPRAAVVDSKGAIKGVKDGTAVITATAKANTKVYKSITVKVTQKSVKVSKTKTSLFQGKTETLTAAVSPSDSIDKAVSWKSSNTKIATVDSKGKVTGKTKGTAVITASVKGAKTVKVTVTVTPPVLASSVKINKAYATVSKGSYVTLSASVSPASTTNKSVKWSSSNTKVAKVDSKGKVTAVGAGSAKITVSTSNRKTAVTTITVPYVKSLGSGNWKGGKDIPAGRYKITAQSGYGNLVIGMGTDRFVNEILSSEYDEYAVTTVTTDIKSGDSIEISGMERVQFVQVKNVKSNTLHAGHWTVGKDIDPGKYRITTTSHSGNLVVTRGYQLLVNEILSNGQSDYGVTSVTTTLKSGDHIDIAGMSKVVFSKR